MRRRTAIIGSVLLLSLIPNAILAARGDDATHALLLGVMIGIVLSINIVDWHSARHSKR